MRFRAPTASLESTAMEAPQDTDAQSTKPKNVRPKRSKKQRVTSRRVRPNKLDKAKTAVKEAVKRAQKTKQSVEPSIAYVGNIGPDIDEKRLIAHFSQCGKILYHENRRVRQYAIVVFETKSARHKACRQENVLDGRSLVVSVVVSDLPEVQEKIVKRLEDYRSRMEPADVRRAQQSAVRSLKLEPTVLLDRRQGKKRGKRMQCMGYSLAEGIM